MALIFVAALPFLLFFGTSIYVFMTLSGETTVVRSRGGGSSMTLPTWQVKLGFLIFLLPFVALFLRRLFGALAHVASQPGATEPSSEAGLALGETIAWKGRQGWRGLDSEWVSGLVLGTVSLLAYGALLWWIWSSSDTLFGKLLWTMFSLALFSGIVYAAVEFGPGALRRLWNNLFGTMVVTDRRIAWLTPWRGEVYHEMDGAALISAAFVEGSDRRGWITVVQRCGDDVKEIDLKGVPRPALALSALANLIRRASLTADAPTAGTSRRGPWG